jgi:hypothetical protein
MAEPCCAAGAVADRAVAAGEQLDEDVAANIKVGWGPRWMGGEGREWDTWAARLGSRRVQRGQELVGWGRARLRAGTGRRGAALRSTQPDRPAPLHAPAPQWLPLGSPYSPVSLVSPPCYHFPDPTPQLAAARVANLRLAASHARTVEGKAQALPYPDVSHFPDYLRRGASKPASHCGLALVLQPCSGEAVTRSPAPHTRCLAAGSPACRCRRPRPSPGARPPSPPSEGRGGPATPAR